MKKYKINEEFYNLNFLKKIVIEFETYLIGEIEIEPFNKFSLEFSSAYWYSCYHLLRDKMLIVDKEIFHLFNEDKINIIWFSITDNENFVIKCLDGEWFLELLNSNFLIEKITPNIKTTEC